MSSIRQQELQKNFKRMFWFRAFLNIKLLNIALSIFFVARGLEVSQIFYLTIIWAVTNLLFEVPSSYLADRWGRKKTLILAVLLFSSHYIVFFFAHSFLLFCVGIFCQALSFSLLSGTEDALIYDTGRELGRDEESLSELGKYYSARHLFKIFVPVIGALLIQDFSPTQFQVLIAFDIVLSLIALSLAVSLVEPNHHVDVEEMEAGVIRDAWKLISSDYVFAKAIFGRVILFIAGFVIWTYHQVFFVERGVPIIVLGVGWGLAHALGFLLHQKIHLFSSRENVSKVINRFNLLAVVIWFFLVLSILQTSTIYLSLFLLLLFFQIENFRWPMYSEFFNRESASFNRATTLSLTSFVKSVFDIPLIFIASILVDIDPLYPFVFSFILGLVVITFFRLSKRQVRIFTSNK